MHFAVYEAAKRWLGSSAETGFASAALSGATATVVSDACMTPFDVIKQRLQARVLLVCLLSEDVIICFLALYGICSAAHKDCAQCKSGDGRCVCSIALQDGSLIVIVWQRYMLTL